MSFCRCCGEDTLEEGWGSYEICPICNWEDDPVQNEDIYLCGGANVFCLKQHRAIYLIINSVIKSNIAKIVDEDDNPYDASKRLAT